MQPPTSLVIEPPSHFCNTSSYVFDKQLWQIKNSVQSQQLQMYTIFQHFFLKVAILSKRMLDIVCRKQILELTSGP